LSDNAERKLAALLHFVDASQHPPAGPIPGPTGLTKRAADDLQ
jgi:hypothetical protein